MASTTTSFHEQPGNRQPSAAALQAQGMMMAAALNRNPGDTAALMYYYQMAEKCWGLNSPPGSDSSSSSNANARPPLGSGSIQPATISPNSPSNSVFQPRPVSSEAFSSPPPINSLTGMPNPGLMMSGLFPPAVAAAAAAARQFAAHQQQASNAGAPVSLSSVVATTNSRMTAQAAAGRSSTAPRTSPSKIPRVGQGQLTCNCGNVFPNLEILEHHAKAVHPENTNLPCTVCTKQFPNLPKLQRHMANHADGPDLRKFKCTTCGKAFKFKHHLKEHERIHSGEKPFECRHCGKRFSHSGSYSSHTTSKKCLQLGRRPTMGGAIAMPNAPQNALRPPLQQQDKPSMPWQQPQLQRPHQKEAMPLSPPLTPLPASIARFPHVPMLNHMSPYHPLLLAAQYQQNQFLQQQQQQQRLPASQEFMENLSRLFQLRTSSGVNGDFGVKKLLQHDEDQVAIDVGKADEETPGSPLSHNNNNNNCSVKSSNEEELKREEEMVDDEMKEEDDEDEEELDDNEPTRTEPEMKPASTTASAPISESFKQLQLNLLKKVCEDIRKNNGGGGQEMPCKFHCGKSFAMPFDLYQHQELCQNNDTNGTQYEESLVSENNGDLNDLNGGLNNSNSSGDERKVRVRTLISDEQLAVLKSYYNRNSRPKREELERISAKIGHPFKVVKVWFQNSRARDRREGKPVSHQVTGGGLPFFSEAAASNFGITGLFPRLPVPPLGLLLNKASLSPRSEAKSPYSEASEDGGLVTVSASADNQSQPLDLSNKGSSPSVSPLSSATKEDPDDNAAAASALNLASTATTPGDFLEHFRRAAAAIQGSASSSASASAVSCGGASSPSVASNLHQAFSGLSRPSLQDIYRFQEDLETSGSAGSGGATTDEEGRYTCEKCDKTFTKQSSLSRHKYEHSDQRPHQCDVCEKAFKHKHHLVEHKRLHSGEKPFECKKCLKRFSHSGSFSQHVNHRYSSCKPPASMVANDSSNNTEEDSIILAAAPEGIIVEKDATVCNNPQSPPKEQPQQALQQQQPATATAAN